MTKRQLICFGTAALIGVPTYLFTRGAIGNTAAVLLMMSIMAPLFLLAMYEKDGLPAEKLVRNYIRAKFYWPGVRPYKTDNFYTNLILKDDPDRSPAANCRGMQPEVMISEQNRKEPTKAIKPQYSETGRYRRAKRVFAEGKNHERSKVQSGTVPKRPQKR